MNGCAASRPQGSPQVTDRDVSISLVLLRDEVKTRLEGKQTHHIKPRKTIKNLLTVFFTVHNNYGTDEILVELIKLGKT
jgi:hypothetical protein